MHEVARIGQVRRIAVWSLAALLVVGCGRGRVDDGRPPSAGSELEVDGGGSDVEATTEASPVEEPRLGEGEVDLGVASSDDGTLDAALLTGADAPDHVARGPWGSGDPLGFYPEGGVVSGFEERLLDCGPGWDWSEEDTIAWERVAEAWERDRPQPFPATTSASFAASDGLLAQVGHTLDDLTPEVAASHVARLDEVAGVCDEWDLQAFEAGSEEVGIVERLDLPPLGDGSTAWRMVWFVPESMPVYEDHVRWYRDGVLSTVTLTWSPVLSSVTDADVVTTDLERDVLAELADITATLDRRLSEVRSGE